MLRGSRVKTWTMLPSARQLGSGRVSARRSPPAFPGAELGPCPCGGQIDPFAEGHHRVCPLLIDRERIRRHNSLLAGLKAAFSEGGGSRSLEEGGGLDAPAERGGHVEERPDARVVVPGATVMDTVEVTCTCECSMSPIGHAQNRGGAARGAVRGRHTQYGAAFWSQPLRSAAQQARIMRTC